MSLTPTIVRAVAALVITACTACVNVASRSESADAASTFYTVTAEIALSRHEPRIGALQYAAAVENSFDPDLLQRATEVSAQCLQPTLTQAVAARWLRVIPGSPDAHRAAARAALELDDIDTAVGHYRILLGAPPQGSPAEWLAFESEITSDDNVYGARRVVDRLAADYAPAVAARVQAVAALRADDPAAAAHFFTEALAGGGATAPDATQRRDLTQGLWRAQILSGDVDAPLVQARASVAQQATSETRLDYAALLLAAQRTAEARKQLLQLTKDSAAAPVALRLLGLIDFQDGKLDAASVHFAELLANGKFVDDAVYYLGLIAERHGDVERALRLYAQVQSGDNEVPALLRAATILRAHGAPSVAEDLMDRLTEEDTARAPEIIAARSRVYSEAGDFPLATDLLNRGRLEFPDAVDLRYAMAALLERKGDASAALRELRAVAKLRPHDPVALNAYGYTLADHDRSLRAARKLIEQAYAAAPKSAAIEDSLGWVSFRQHQNEEALRYLQAAYASDPGGDIAAHLGEVLWQLGRRTEAEQVWTQGNLPEGDNALIKSTRLRLQAAG